MIMRNVLEIITRGIYASDFKIQILKGFMDERDLNDKGNQRERAMKRGEREIERERKRERDEYKLL